MGVEAGVKLGYVGGTGQSCLYCKQDPDVMLNQKRELQKL